MACLHAALNGSDFVGTTANLVFPAGSSTGATQCINIIILDDGVRERDERFTVMLMTFDPGVITGNNETTVVIIDDNGNFNTKITMLRYGHGRCPN